MQVDETIIKELEEATSTNTLLTTWIKEENVPEGSILVARRQTQGRVKKETPGIVSLMRTLPSAWFYTRWRSM